MLRDCPAHGIWIETRMTGVSAADDFVNVTSIATSTACPLECRVCREDCPGLLQQPRPVPGHEAIHATVDPDTVDGMPSGNTLLLESSEFWQSPSLATGWPLEIDVSMWPNHPLEHLQDIAQQMSTLLSFLGQSCSLVWCLDVEILYLRPCSAWNRHPDPTGGLLLDQFENFQHTPHLFEIVAGFQCHPLGAQLSNRVTCDGALRMAAHLPDAGSAAGRTAATAATAVGAGRAVGAAAGG